MPERSFLIFWLFFFLFSSEFSCPGRIWTEFGSKFFFFSFLAYLIPFWLKIMLEWFFNFFIFFFYFFRNFIARVQYENNSGLKFFFLFLSLYQPIFATNNVRKRFFIILNFFAIFIGIFLTGSSMNGIRD